MPRLTPFLLAIACLFCRPLFAADRTLAGEGDYVSQQHPNKPPAHWKVWRLRNGDYVVEETIFPGDIVQVFKFDAQFLPTGFSLTIDPNRVNSRAQPQKPPFPIYRSTVSCSYLPQELTCETEANGTKSTTSIPAKQPYVFIPGEFYALDQLWLMTGLVRLAEHSQSEDKTVNVYAMFDNKLRAIAPMQLTPAGKETAMVMGKVQPVTKYEIWSGGREPGAWVLNELSVLQVTSHGLVAAVHGKRHPELGYIISNYTEYEPWMPSR